MAQLINTDTWFVVYQIANQQGLVRQGCVAVKRSEKRTVAIGIDIDVESFQAPQLGLEDPPPGVGARQTWEHLPGPGGGYQGICTDSNFDPAKSRAIADRRFVDLVAMNLNPVWLKVAASIGVDAFLEMWRIIDEHPPHWHDSGRLRLQLRRYSGYKRFQRNRYVEAMYRLGVPLPEIRRRVHVAFDEKLTEAQLSRIGGKK